MTGSNGVPNSPSTPSKPAQSLAVTVFFVALVVGFACLVVALLASDTTVPRPRLITTTFFVVYLAAGFFLGIKFPQHYWTTVIGVCAVVLLLSSVFGGLMLLAEQMRQEDRDVLLVSALSTTGSILGAVAGVAAGRRLRRRP